MHETKAVRHDIARRSGHVDCGGIEHATFALIPCHPVLYEMVANQVTSCKFSEARTSTNVAQRSQKFIGWADSAPTRYHSAHCNGQRFTCVPHPVIIHRGLVS